MYWQRQIPCISRILLNYYISISTEFAISYSTYTGIVTLVLCFLIKIIESFSVLPDNRNTLLQEQCKRKLDQCDSVVLTNSDAIIGNGNIWFYLVEKNTSD